MGTTDPNETIADLPDPKTAMIQDAKPAIINPSEPKQGTKKYAAAAPTIARHT